MTWNGTINVTYDDEHNRQLISVNIDEFCYFELVKKKIVGHTLTSTYLLPWNGMKVLIALLRTSCNHFERMDKAYIVNLHKIKRIDWEWGILYFHEQPKDMTKRCYIAETYISELRQRLKQMNVQL
ncbi:LytTR family transcriptional regulator DNA-binding domain-containing protein [Cohnella herbarum]|uniref:LytTR family transcriptional regulator n=1 Tax=Cohnella herbarum TaxID=2728023 RepID=A0A7Z2VMS8_9BACL|nr:LytTR family transcriptional regulator DNA-binding domain-containing protein [Cohnella herbarum]QJD85932.1 LytTR family transcriptional regulator [Cohnella herbarum]